LRTSQMQQTIGLRLDPVWTFGYNIRYV